VAGVTNAIPGCCAKNIAGAGVADVLATTPRSVPVPPSVELLGGDSGFFPSNSTLDVPVQGWCDIWD
jgi:hypothetical protein